MRSPTSRLSAVAALSVAVLSSTLALSVSAASASAPALYRYSIHTTAQTVQVEDASEGPCGVADVVTFDFKLNTAVSSTQAGLTDAEVLALLEDDPTGLIVQVTYTQIGTFSAVTENDHTYEGRFAGRYGGRLLPTGGFVFSGTFTGEGRSEIGTKFAVHYNGHDLESPDAFTKNAFDKQRVTGCLP